MRIVLMAALGAAAFSPLSLAQASTPQQPSASTQPAASCPEGYKGTPDDNGDMWCMDSSKRNYTPENARAVFAYESANAKTTQSAQAEHKSFWHKMAFWQKN